MTDSFSLNLLQNYTVLVAEDDAEMRSSLARILGSYFGRVLEADSGQAALEIFADQKPHAVFLDISMPGPDGLEVAGHFKQAEPELPIIILTCHSDVSYMQAALRMRLLDYLIKPVNLPDLEKALERCLKALLQSEPGHVRLSGGTMLDLEAGIVSWNKQTHKLTANERQFLKILLAQKGTMVETFQICLAMSSEKDFSPQALRNLVWRLRSKISKQALISSRDLGYMLR